MNALLLAGNVETEYKNYLRTLFHFRNAELRQQFAEALDQGQLANGPFLELTPLYEPAGPPSSVLSQLANFPSDSGLSKTLNDLTRNLHRHQERALRAIWKGKNIVVATGTGSGKTEAFLYPILAQLYREHLAGALSPGVRALVLYPMNALANDQRERMGRICERLSKSEPQFRLSFGEYTGHTPENERDSFRSGAERARNRLPGELVFREEMQARPPHILLTNYSMLEYLLLRPKDSEFFDKGAGATWKFLVLDEAHQYRGARGIEMAMLLRRLKSRLAHGGMGQRLQCIATSATLADGLHACAPVASFASRLFDEPFEPEDVILATKRPAPSPIAGRRISSRHILALRAASIRDDASSVADIVSTYGIKPASDVASTLADALDTDERVSVLRTRAADRAEEVEALLPDLFPDASGADRNELLIAFIDLITRARRPQDGTAILHARFHLFVRALEGAFVQFYPSTRLRLERGAPEEHEDQGATFELALCRECGQHYILAQRDIRPGQVVEPVRDADDDRFGVTYLRPLDPSGKDEEPENEDARWNLCLRCGRLDRGNPSCGHSMALQVVAERRPDDRDRADQLQACGVCGYTASGRDPVREIVHGADGPNAVIATSLVRYQDEDRRKVLTFADSRQSAAFFAWFLQDSYGDIQSRNLILAAAKALRRATDAPTLGELSHKLLHDLDDLGMFSGTLGTIDRKREAWKRILRELLTDERRISLEGVGLVQWQLNIPQGFQVPTLLLNPPWSLSPEQAIDLVRVLLDSLRLDRAVRLAEVEPGIEVRWPDLGLLGANRVVRLGPPRGQKNVVAWDGPRTRRARLLQELLRQRGVSTDEATVHAQPALLAIWDACQRRQGAREEGLIEPTNDASVLNWRWYRLKIIDGVGQLCRCDTCNRLHPHNGLNRCLNPHCAGNLLPVTGDDPVIVGNHFRLLYSASDLPMQFRVEEHTAQIDHTEASRFQREFQERRIQVLSCSTTFELGVDLGDLDTLLLRNVPPEPFNYAQRAGRSGRRSTPGFVVTFCRRDPHDLQHFRTPARMIAGRTGPPLLTLVNDRIILRHMTAVALSRFFRAHPSRFGSNHVKDFFIDLASPAACGDFKAFVDRCRHDLRAELEHIVPGDVWRLVGLTDDSWSELLAGSNSSLMRAEQQVAADYQAVRRFKDEAARSDKASDFKWAINRARTMEDEDVLGFLSRRAVIPKYGFPVDVVELDTQMTDRKNSAVSLSRDLSIAIGEYAPECDVVANKRQWSSYGLKRVPEKEWSEYQFARCPSHHAFVDCRKESGPPQPLSCGCPAPILNYVVPEFGFTTSREGSTEPRRYRTREFTTRPYFAGTRGEPREPMEVQAPSRVLSITPASPGWMVILCEGPEHNGFYVCRACGYGSRQRKKDHKNPRGSTCNGKQESVCLGHRFCTDVVRVEFHVKSEHTDEEWLGLTHSLAQAIATSAARILEVERDDVSAVVAATTTPTSGVCPIILYDTVPGGAGLVARLSEDVAVLRKCLEEAQSIVSGACGCDPTTSCDGCLRTYRNRYLYELLRRGPVHEYVGRVLERWSSLTVEVPRG